MFGCPIIAKYIRIQPLEWSAHIALRFDVIGCRATTGKSQTYSNLPHAEIRFNY